MLCSKYQCNWKSSEKCTVIILVWSFKVIASKEYNAPMALWGHTKRQVLINKDRKTTLWELISAKKMLSQLKIIISLFSAWNIFNTSAVTLFYFYAALISHRKRGIAPQLNCFGMGRGSIDQLTPLLHRCAQEPSQKTPESRWSPAPTRCQPSVYPPELPTLRWCLEACAPLTPQHHLSWY